MSTLTAEEFTGYTFEVTEEPNSLGNKIICTAYNSNHEAVTSSSSAYANGSGYGYARVDAIKGCKSNLRTLIENNFNIPKEEPYDTDFLNTLANEQYITDYGELSTGELVIVFDSWSQVEGEEEREYVEGKGMVKTGNFKKSVYAKLRELTDKDLLKPSINRTIKEVEFVFTDSYTRCNRCDKYYDTEWEGIRYVEGLNEVLCDGCINEDTDAVEALIERAKEDFKHALPVEIDEDVIESLGYVKITDEQDFSTRYSQWGEKNYGAFNTPVDVVEEVCKMYEGFPKLTAVWQFDCEYTLYFPADTVEYARRELGIDVEDEDDVE